MSDPLVLEAGAVVLDAECCAALVRNDPRTVAAVGRAVEHAGRRWLAEHDWRAGLLPVAEVARRTGLSEKALRDRARRGTVAAEQRAGRWFIEPSSVQPRR